VTALAAERDFAAASKQQAAEAAAALEAEAAMLLEQKKQAVKALQSQISQLQVCALETSANTKALLQTASTRCVFELAGARQVGMTGAVLKINAPKRPSNAVIDGIMKAGVVVMNRWRETQ
jgi:hypothetical protein